MIPCVLIPQFGLEHLRNLSLPALCSGRLFFSLHDRSGYYYS